MIAVVSDTHLPRGSRVLPARCVDYLGKAALIVHAGDFTASSVLAELEAIGAPVAAVHGNQDDEALRARLPDRVTVEVEGMRIGIVHDGGPATRRHERLRRWFPGCSMIIYGHTHRPELARDGEGWILNPGSPTERRRASAHTMIVIRAGVPALVEL